ncbi:MAG: glycosyl hydrolase 53 family protein [Bacilli bacterium]|nr:glycosyl hydrolase 53 family protein [Bacilli bacterium]
MILGIDVSTYLEQQRLTHQVYRKDGKIIDPFEIFKSQGVTHIRTRIWNNPHNEKGEDYLGGTCDLDNFINLYRHLKKYDFKYLVDFHYSDFWTDPSKQFMPKAWKDLTFEELLDAVYLFTRDSLKRIKDEGVDVTHVQIGNEITHGMLWPHGELRYKEERRPSFRKLSALLKSGINGVKEVYPNAEIIIHLEQSYDQACYDEFIYELRENGVQFDIMGSSYYPFWHHGFDEYFANQDMIKNKYHLKTMTCEVGYPFTLKDYHLKNDDKAKHLVINEDNLKDFIHYLPSPISKAGQASFMKEFLALARKHGLDAVYYWEPLWVPGEGICWASEDAQKYQNLKVKDSRNEWANQCMFDYDGEANPILDEYK